MQHQIPLSPCRIIPSGGTRIAFIQADPYSGGRHAADGHAGTEVVS